MGIAQVVVEGPRGGSVQGKTVFSHTANPGMDFVGEIACLVVSGAANSLGQVDAIGSFLPGIKFPKGFVSGPPSGVQLVHQVDDVVLDSLEPSDRPAELYPGAAVIDG